MKSLITRSFLIAITLVVLVVMIMLQGSVKRSPVSSANLAARELKTQVVFAAQLQRQCQIVSLAGSECSASMLADSTLGKKLKLRQGIGCVAPESKCVDVRRGVVTIQIVSRPIVSIGALRLEAESSIDSSRLDWSCQPLRATIADANIVKRACDGFVSE